MTISPAPAPQAARPPPKKGPQTFEEMGVPAAPKESECVSCCKLLEGNEYMLTINIGVDVIPRRTNDCDEDIWISPAGWHGLAAWKDMARIEKYIHNRQSRRAVERLSIVEYSNCYFRDFTYREISAVDVLPLPSHDVVHSSCLLEK